MISEIIVKYWLEAALGLAVTALTFCYKKLASRLKKRADEQDAIKTAMIAMLHDRLFAECNKYLSQGHIPVDDAEEILNNLNILYCAYHALGGNGTGTTLYERVGKLKIE